MSNKERAQAIIKDVLVNHLPRVKEGLEKGYVDENQILVMYDHAVRARILTESEEAKPYNPGLPNVCPSCLKPKPCNDPKCYEAVMTARGGY